LGRPYAGHGHRHPHRHSPERAAYVQAGAGIVADSVPEREFAETEGKAGALLRALALANAH